jgi:hypothetical protein
LKSSAVAIVAHHHQPPATRSRATMYKATMYKTFEQEQSLRFKMHNNITKVIIFDDHSPILQVYIYLEIWLVDCPQGSLFHFRLPQLNGMLLVQEGFLQDIHGLAAFLLG